MPSRSTELEWTPSLQAILGPDPGSQLYGQVSVWFHKLGMFRQGEDRRIFQSTPTHEDLKIHRRLLSRLISDGEHLAHVIKQSGGLIENPESIRIEDLEAAIESLRDTFRGSHEPMSSERREQILKEVFKDVA